MHRLSVVMVSRLVINLRDPTLHGQTDSNETDTTYVGHVSTVLLEMNTVHGVDII